MGRNGWNLLKLSKVWYILTLGVYGKSSERKEVALCDKGCPSQQFIKS